MIFVGTHHKAGTVLFAHIFSAVARWYSLNFFIGDQDALPLETQVWFDGHSKIDRAAFTEIVGIHVVRHPLELISSAYRYHLAGEEKWFSTRESGKRFGLKGLSYRQNLSKLSVRDGILFEMRSFSAEKIMEMYKWDYQDTRFLNIKLEDVIANFDATLSRAFSFIGLDPSESLAVARRFDINRLSQTRIAKMNHVTNKNGSLTWRHYFSDADMIDQFSRMFPKDLLPKLGYSPLDPSPMGHPTPSRRYSLNIANQFSRSFTIENSRCIMQRAARHLAGLRSRFIA